MDTTILEGLGLSKGEIKAYMTLLELGETKVGDIIEKSGMASSAVHNAVNSLIDQGLVSYVKKGKIKHYKAVPPKQLIDFIDNKKKKLKEILPELESKQKKSKEKQEAEVFEGTKGIMAMMNLLIENTKKGEEYVFFAEQDPEIQDFFIQYDAKRKAKGLIVKGLASKGIKKAFLKRKSLNMKYPNTPIPGNISVCNDKTAVFTWGEKPIGYLIQSKEIAEMYTDYFNKMWKISK